MHQPSVFPDRPPHPAGGHPEHLLGRAALATALLVALFAGLLALVQGGWGPLVRMDHGWVDPLHSFARQHTAWTASMRTLTDIGGPVTMRILLGLAAVWLWCMGARVLAGWAAAVTLVGWLASVAVKAAVGRPRPGFADPVATAPGGSFPSGHAIASALTCAALVALIWPRAGRAGRITASALATLMTLAVGWSRVALGVHWPSDILGGWLAAGAVLAGVTAAIELWQPGAMLRDVRRVDWRTRPRVQRVLASESPDPEEEQEEEQEEDGPIRPGDPDGP